MPFNQAAMRGVIAAVLPLALPACTSTDAPPAMTADQRAAIAGDPAFRAAKLTLADIPAPAGAAINLFNGRDLSGWSPWLGYPDPSVTYNPGAQDRPIGAPQNAGQHFGVRMVDGAPAIWIKGETWGSLLHSADFADYHLRMEFKWGDKTYAPRLTEPQNNGLLYHSYGPQGAVWGTWARSAEFEIMKGSTGMIVPVGAGVKARTTVGYDPSILYPHRRFMPGGRDIDVIGNTAAWNVEGHSDRERPVGQWNVLDLYVLGDRAVHVVNGVPVMAVRDLATVDADGNRRPLNRGRIQFQSEGAETYLRNITVTPIRSLPRIVSAP
ncbi:3-keto-disaccharide hydrolase [Sphingomonas sp. FW199]|uniref:3-keto-disaccharide hydrolase n=1 Tax=Sphingomonas sp. FW199 TaxID=3400217 RepID=UPI003CF08272